MDPRGLMRQVSTQDIFNPQDQSSERGRATHSHLQTEASVKAHHTARSPCPSSNLSKAPTLAPARRRAGK